MEEEKGYWVLFLVVPRVRKCPDLVAQLWASPTTLLNLSSFPLTLTMQGETQINGIYL